MSRRCSRCRASNHVITHCPELFNDFNKLSRIHLFDNTTNLYQYLRQNFTADVLARFVREQYGIVSGSKDKSIATIIEYGINHQEHELGHRLGHRLDFAAAAAEEDVVIVEPPIRGPSILNQECILIDDLYEYIDDIMVQRVLQRISDYRQVCFVEATYPTSQPKLPFNPSIPVAKASRVAYYDERIPIATTVEFM
jgi:hypothetical protein